MGKEFLIEQKMIINVLEFAANHYAFPPKRSLPEY